MPLSRRLLQPLLSRALIHPRLHSLLQARYEWLRRLQRRPHQIVVWLRLNDPYSYLLVQALPRFLAHFSVQLIFKILPYREPDHTFTHHVRDAWYLAQFHQLYFHDFQSPSEECCFTASQLLLANRHLPIADFLTLAKQVFSCLWEHQTQKLSTLTLRFKLLAKTTTEKKMRVAAEEFDRQNQHKAAQLYYQGEWYWGLDDLSDLGDRLTTIGLNQLSHQFQLNSDSIYQDNDYLINDWEQLATIRAQKYPLDYYFSFDDPLSYIYLPPVIALAEHYQLKLHLKPILLNQDNTSLSLEWHTPLNRYVRLAEKYRLPFGEICLPNEQGLHACFTLFDHAQQQGMTDNIALALLTAIWAQGLDVGHTPHLKKILAQCECELPSLKKQLKTQEWLPQIEQYTVEWSALEVSELPSFYLQGHRRIVFSGAHRLWAIEMALVDNMKLIGTI